MNITPEKKQEKPIYYVFKSQIYRYNSGYFYPINSMIACPLIQDLVEKFGGKSETFEEKDVSMPNATFYFSHSEAVLPFLRLLGLYRWVSFFVIVC